ncbi:MAG TPA: cellulase family glycosylhydrolase, partial [Candidatus Caenarcaniphilales bacterium]
MKITKTRRQSRRTSLIAGAALLTLATLVSFAAKPPVPAQAQSSERPNPERQSDGSFRVSGTKILAPNGREFVIKGVSINGPNWYWGEDMTQPRHLDKIVDCWKFNFVRVSTNILPTRGVSNDNNDVDKLVQAYTSRGIVTMFTPHDRTGDYFEGGDLTKLKNYWRKMASEYKDNPYVWFNIMN